MWKELSRRCETDLEDGVGLDLNPCLVVTFVAELVGEWNGEVVYCTTCWTPYMPDIYAFEVEHKPVFRYLVDLETEIGDALDRVRADALICGEVSDDYDGPFAEQFRVTKQLIEDRAVKEGFRTETYDDSDDLDDL